VEWNCTASRLITSNRTATRSNYFTIPQRCNALQETKGDDGLARYTCGVYETRPQMCRDYDGSIAGPLGV